MSDLMDIKSDGRKRDMTQSSHSVNRDVLYNGKAKEVLYKDTEGLDKNYYHLEEYIEVDPAAESVTLEFTFFELDSWNNEDLMINVNGDSILIGGFDWRSEDKDQIGVVQKDHASGIEWVHETASSRYDINGSGWLDQHHTIRMEIPKSVYAFWGEVFVSWFANVDSDVKNESFHIQDVKLTSNSHPLLTDDELHDAINFADAFGASDISGRYANASNYLDQVNARIDDLETEAAALNSELGERTLDVGSVNQVKLKQLAGTLEKQMAETTDKLEDWQGEFWTLSAQEYSVQPNNVWLSIASFLDVFGSFVGLVSGDLDGLLDNLDLIRIPGHLDAMYKMLDEGSSDIARVRGASDDNTGQFTELLKVIDTYAREISADSNATDGLKASAKKLADQTSIAMDEISDMLSSALLRQHVDGVVGDEILFNPELVNALGFEVTNHSMIKDYTYEDYVQQTHIWTIQSGANDNDFEGVDWVVDTLVLKETIEIDDNAVNIGAQLTMGTFKNSLGQEVDPTKSTGLRDTALFTNDAEHVNIRTYTGMVEFDLNPDQLVEHSFDSFDFA